MSLKSASRIPGRFAFGGVLLVPVEINGQPTDFLFDPGAATTGINQEFAEYFGIKLDPIRRTTLYIADKEPIYVPMGVADEFRIGGVLRKNLTVVIINFPSQSALRGVVGMNFLKGLRFTVEMDTGTLILREVRKS